jgi:hypothetical protein
MNSHSQARDKMTRFWLILLTAGIWGLLLRPFVEPTAAGAQNGRDECSTGASVAVNPTNGHIIAVSNGTISVWEEEGMGGNKLRRKDVKRLPPDQP